MNALLSTAASQLPSIALAVSFAASLQPPRTDVFQLAKKKNQRGARAKFLNDHLNRDAGLEPPSACRLCHGEGVYPCQVCHRRGVLTRGGFSPRNTVHMPSLVGSKWTSVSAIDGKWRHFLCVGKRGSNTRDGVAILSSTCGPVANRIRLEIPLKQLKSRELWEGGWTTLNDIRAGTDLPPTICSACSGLKVIPCPRCDGLGRSMGA